MIKQSRLVIFVVTIGILVGACGSRNIFAPETSTSSQTTQKTIPIPAVTGTLSAPNEVSAGLDGLEFDAFVEASYRRLLSRDPETVLELGLSKAYAAPTDLLTDISDDYIRQTQAPESIKFYLLQQYDRSTLTTQQQLTSDIYTWHLADRVRGHEFMHDDYPINPTVFSIHIDLLQFFTDLRPVTNLQEAQDYITCLSQVDIKFEQLIDGLKRREDKGVMLPGFLVKWVLENLNEIAKSSARFTPYFAAFDAKVSILTDISEADKQSILTEAEEAINTAVIPAYQALVNYFEHFQ